MRNNPDALPILKQAMKIHAWMPSERVNLGFPSNPTSSFWTFNISKQCRFFGKLNKCGMALWLVDQSKQIQHLSSFLQKHAAAFQVIQLMIFSNQSDQGESNSNPKPEGTMVESRPEVKTTEAISLSTCNSTTFENTLTYGPTSNHQTIRIITDRSWSRMSNKCSILDQCLQVRGL